MGLLHELFARVKSSVGRRDLAAPATPSASASAPSSARHATQRSPADDLDAIITPGSAKASRTQSMRVTTIGDAGQPRPAATQQRAVPATHGFRMRQLVGDNPPMGSTARVVRRKYRSIVREREHNLDDNDKDVDAVAMYEVEFPKNPSSLAMGEEKHLPLGIDLETDFYGKHAVVKEVKRGSVAYSLSHVIRPGHYVVAVNGKDLADLSFQDVLHELRNASAPRVIRFLDPTVLPLKHMQYEKVLLNRDQYGFAKDDRYILKYRKQLRKRKHATYKNELRWAEFVQRYHGLDEIDRLLHSEIHEERMAREVMWQELRRHVFRGIPVVLRPRIWSILAHVTPYKREYADDYYRSLVKKMETSPSLGDIEKDICRTYPEHPFFQSDRGKAELKSVLCAYSLHNPRIGYCQSMNFIAGMMLLFMPEEDAFWLLCVMMGKAYLPAENYTQNMMGTQTDQLVFKWLVSVELPTLSARLEACGIQIQLITLHWFLCAFVCTLPTESALRMWDWFFMDGEEVMFTVAIGILKLAEDRIMEVTCHSDLHTIVRELGTDVHNDDEFMRFLLTISKIPIEDPDHFDVSDGMSVNESNEGDGIEHGDADSDNNDDDDDDEYADGAHDDNTDNIHLDVPTDKHGDDVKRNSSMTETVVSPTQPSLSSPFDMHPRKSPKKRFRFKLGKRLLAVLDSDRSKQAQPYFKQFTIEDISKRRREFRQQIEMQRSGSFGSLTAKR